jgi:MFS family permease
MLPTDTPGRFTLSFLGHQMGERLFVFLVTFGVRLSLPIQLPIRKPHPNLSQALIIELLVWFVPSIPGDSVAVAFSGLLLGPIYPCSVHIFHRLIPGRMLISSLSLIASVGSSGGAVAPFITGILAQKVGTYVLHPICIGLFVVMGACWSLLPKVEKRTE